jgi:hypothetical protein
VRRGHCGRLGGGAGSGKNGRPVQAGKSG